MIVSVTNTQPDHLELETSHCPSSICKTTPSWPHYGAKCTGCILRSKWMISWTLLLCFFSKSLFIFFTLSLASITAAASLLLIIKIPRNWAGFSHQVLDCNFWKRAPPPRSYLVWSHLWAKVSHCLYQCKQFIMKVQSANIGAASYGSPGLSFQLPLIS